ncbi:MAG TPA: ABC transporter ATP-binding protein [Bacillus sp. (in: firmicutes)]|uniref:ABC transporter ATP-binding protein n=1 Tax=Bacillus litorisediminis TaxID=2922713 RepID=UPI001FABE3EE|nr:ABC transporter ATP-binding protein [Bacillus litorisediminis]HWO76763.1 ABC transporter ATP-binding protein [Bacillus sp. (in: firmicutes)]
MIPILEIHDLSKTYRKRKSKEFIEAVNGINLTVHKGETVGLLGPNGAGKTTFIKMMCGLLIPTRGEVLINGISIHHKRLKALKHISVVLEGSRNLYWRLTVKENLEYFAGNRGLSKKSVQDKITELLDMFNLTDKAHEMVNSLSRGMQQKVSIAVALLADTEIIFLDEPTLGLDVETSYEIRNILKDIAKKEGKTILMSSHDMPVVQDVCERVVIINKGKVVADERVHHLLSLFESKAYAFTISSPLHESQMKDISEKYMLTAGNDEQGNQILNFTIADGHEFYAIIDSLKKYGVTIEKIDRTTVDFEQAFIHIVKGDGVRETAASL